jgi:hypothetical protein
MVHTSALCAAICPGSIFSAENTKSLPEPLLLQVLSERFSIVRLICSVAHQCPKGGLYRVNAGIFFARRHLLAIVW